MERTRDHIHHGYDAELARLEGILAEMGGRCEQQLELALKALEARDDALARQVVVADQGLDRLERDAEELVVRLFALRQPVAVDLRTVLGSLKLASGYERVGDNVKHIAKRALELNAAPPVAAVGDVLSLGRSVRAALNAANDAAARRDAEAAERVWEADAAIDTQHRQASRAISECSAAEPRHGDACVHLHFVAKALERIGDHATNLAEVVAFQVRGRRLPEERPKGQ